MNNEITYELFNWLMNQGEKETALFIENGEIYDEMEDFLISPRTLTGIFKLIIHLPPENYLFLQNHPEKKDSYEKAIKRFFEINYHEVSAILWEKLD